MAASFTSASARPAAPVLPCFVHGLELHRQGSTASGFGPLGLSRNPGRNELFVADPDVLMAMLVKRKDFVKPDLYKFLDVYGVNVNTSNDDDWERHRKVTAPCFNERVSSQVWKEASNQSQAMLSQWLASFEGRTYSMVDDARVVALHVLSAVGFGVSNSFGKGVRISKADAGYTMSYRDALMTILYNIPLVFLFSFNHNAMLWPIMPKSLKKVGRAVHEFGSYMKDMLEHERDLQLPSGSAVSPPNLMSTLIRSSDKARNGPKQKSSQYLSDEEIYGNLFAFNLAGHDTTANTMAFAIALLALEPKWQEWIRDEIRLVMAEHPAANYEACFPKLKRCLAVMYETLRLYPPGTYMPRTVKPFSTIPIPALDKTIIIPPNTTIILNLLAVHTSSNHWPDDPLSFRPDRFIQPPRPENPNNNNTSAIETLITPKPGTFCPWAGGPRACIGMKFAQVEFVSVMVQLFRDARVRPVGGEEGRMALAKTVEDSGYDAVTLAMRRPGDVRLLWERVAG